MANLVMIQKVKGFEVNDHQLDLETVVFKKFLFKRRYINM